MEMGVGGGWGWGWADGPMGPDGQICDIYSYPSSPSRSCYPIIGLIDETFVFTYLASPERNVQTWLPLDDGSADEIDSNVVVVMVMVMVTMMVIATAMISMDFNVSPLQYDLCRTLKHIPESGDDVMT